MRLSRLLAAAMLFVSPAFADAPKAIALDADEALALLKDGNVRFAAGESTFPHLDQDRRCATVEGGQHPIASILTCADSRVPAELLFDAGIGDLFVVRVAGNVADVDEIGTLEYGAGRLGVPLIVVMGHTKCDAVTAVVQGVKSEGYLSKLTEHIAPAVAEARVQYAGVPEAKLVQQSIRANVRQSVKDLLTRSTEIRELVAAGKVHVIGAVYDLHNGTIEWLGEHPQQTALLKDVPADAHEASADDELIAPVEVHTAREGEQPHGTTPVEAEPAAAKKLAHAASHETPTERPHASPKSAAVDGHVKVEPSPLAPSHDEEPTEKPAVKGESNLHGELTTQQKAAERGKAADHEPTGHDAASPAEPAESLVKKQGLLLPGAFMAAGSALSGTLVFLLKGRRPATASTPASASEPAVVPH